MDRRNSSGPLDTEDILWNFYGQQTFVRSSVDKICVISLLQVFYGLRLLKTEVLLKPSLDTILPSGIPWIQYLHQVFMGRRPSPQKKSFSCLLQRGRQAFRQSIDRRPHSGLLVKMASNGLLWIGDQENLSRISMFKRPCSGLLWIEYLLEFSYVQKTLRVFYLLKTFGRSS